MDHTRTPEIESVTATHSRMSEKPRKNGNAVSVASPV